LALTAGEARLAIVPDASRFKALLEADMRKIRAEFALHVTADVAQARADIDRFRETQQRNGMKLPVDVALAQAQADMEAFRARQHANGITVPVDVDTGGLRRARSEVDSFTKKLADIGPGPLGNAFQFGGSLALLGELPAATTGVAQLAAALQQLAGAGLAIPGILGGVAASVGTLVLGLSGIGDAYDALSKASLTSGQDQAQAARTAQSAQNSYRNSVVDAAQAQRDQARAVQDARRELEDLNISLKGGQISEEQAKNDALRQRRDLQHDLATGQIKDQIDLQARLLDIEASDQRVVESHQRNLELTDKVTDANQRGISGNDGVVSANERVTRSGQAVADAQAGVAAASTNASAAVTAANQAMAVLGPNAQEVVRTLVDLKPAFNDLRTSTSQPLLAGVSQEIRDVTGELLPNLKTGLGSIATALNSNIKALGASVSSDSSQGLLDRILGNTAEAQNRVSAFIDPLVHGIGTLTAAGTDALPRIVDDLGHLAERFSNFIDAADKDGRLDKWINDGITGFEHLGSILGNLGTSFTAITQAVGGGEGLLGMLDRGSQKLSEFLNSVEGQNKLKEWFEEGRREIQEHIIPLLQALPGFFKGVIDVGTQIANVVVPPLRDISKFLGDHPALIHAVVDAFLAWKTITGVAGLITNLEKISTALRVTLPADAAAGAAGMTSALGPVAALVASIFAATHGHPQDYVGMGPDSPGKAASQGDWGKALFGDAWGPISKLLGLDSGGGNNNAPSAPTPSLPPGSLPPSAITGAHDSPPAPPKPPPPPTPSLTRQELFAKVAAGQLPGYSIGPNGTIIGPAGQTISVPGFDRGGATSGPASGYPAMLHGTPGRPEFVQQSSAVGKYGIGFMSALNEGRIDPRVLPRFDQGGYIDQWGNPVTPGMLPGPSIDPTAPIAPNPTSGGVLPAVQTAIGGLQGPLGGLVSGALSNSGIPGLSSIPGLGGNQTPGATAGTQQDPGQYLAGWGGNLLAGLATTAYTGVLGFFGLENSILSPSNPWFQDATKSLGIFNNMPGMTGASTAAPQMGSQSITLGDGSVIQVPTYGTSSGTGQPGVAAGTALPAGKAGEGHLQNKTITAERVLSQAFPMISDIGGWREKDAHPDHPSGQALDLMIPKDLVGTPQGLALGNRIQQFVQQNAGALGAKYTIWQQRYSDVVSGASNIMEDRGSPTQNHMDHVHITFEGGGYPTAGQQFTSPLSFSPFAFDKSGNVVSTGGATTPTAAAPPPSGPTPAWDLIAQKESSGDWHLNTGNGYFGGLQFKQSTWEQFGGTQFAARADMATRDQQIAIAQRVYAGQGAGAWPNTFTTTSSVSIPTADVGNWLQPGVSLMANFTKKPEPILPHEQFQAIQALAKNAATPTPPPRPNFQVPDAQTLTPPRGAAPQPPPPVAQTITPDQPPPPQQPPLTGPQPSGGAPGDGKHLLPAVEKGITSTATVIGNIAQTAAAIGTFGAAGMAGGLGGGGGGMGGPSIAGAIQQLGKIAVNVANVGASALVGSVPGSFGDPNMPAGGQTLRPQQKVPQTAPLGPTNVWNIQGVDHRNMMDAVNLQQAQNMQAQLATL
jgi:hypothetical protein